MDKSRLRNINLKEVIALSIGTFLVSIGGGVGVFYSFRYSIPEVFLSFILFVAGYKISQIGTDELKDFRHTIKNSSLFPTNIKKLLQNLLFLTGALVFSTGFIELAKAVEQFSIRTGIVAGTLILGGYILAHVTINKRLV